MYGTDISSLYSKLAKVTASAVRGQSASQNLEKKGEEWRKVILVEMMHMYIQNK